MNANERSERRRPPQVLFWNEFWTTHCQWTTHTRPEIVRDYLRRILPGVVRRPDMLWQVLRWPLAAALFKFRRLDRSDLFVYSLAAEMAGQAPFRPTLDRRRLDQADLVVFHLPTLDPATLPPKRPGQVWVGISHECEQRYPRMTDPGLRARLDFTMDQRQSSDIPVPYFTPDIEAALRRPPLEKTAEAPAILMISSDDDLSDRLAFAREVMEHLPVHSYGRRLRNRAIKRDRGLPTKLGLISRYKFTLAFENARAADYVTEKFFQPLRMGSVPVYLGAPNVDDFAPGERCFINVDDFAGPRELAAHLLALDADDAAYAEYLEWKTRPLRPRFLSLLEMVRVPPFVRLFREIEHGAPGPPDRPSRPASTVDPTPSSRIDS